MKLVSTRATDIILGQFSKGNIFCIDTGNDWKICCPFHGERTPSLFISKGQSSIEVGIFHCFGCGKKGNWNILANKLGLKKIDSSDIEAIGSVAPNLKKQMKQSITDLMAEDMEYNTLQDTDYKLRKEILLPVAKITWRGISHVVQKRFGCKRFVDQNETYIVIPVTTDGQIRGCIKARFKKVSNKPSYYNSNNETEGWVKQFGLLGFDRIRSMPSFKKHRIIYLVEGPRDVMHLHHFKIPAIAILGSKNWSTVKRNLLLTLKPKKVVVLFDNDKAGKEAANFVFESFGNLCSCKVYRLPSKVNDPAELSKRDATKIVSRCK